VLKYPELPEYHGIQQYTPHENILKSQNTLAFYKIKTTKTKIPRITEIFRWDKTISDFSSFR